MVRIPSLKDTVGAEEWQLRCDLAACDRWKRSLAMRAEKPLKIFSALVLAVVALGAIAKERSSLTETFAVIGPVVLGFNVLSLLAGYYLSPATGLDEAMSTAIRFEIGIHNSTLAIFSALTVLTLVQLALPAAMYSVSLYFTATLLGLLVLRRSGRSAPSATP